MTVREMLSKLDSRELTEWRAYFRLEKELSEEKAPLESDLSANLSGYKRQ